MSKKLFFLAVFIISPIFCLFTQPNFEIIGNIHFIPDNYFVGDEVKCYVKLKLLKNNLILSDKQLKLPNRSDLIVKDVKIYPKSDLIYDIVITFIPFYPQQQKIPNIKLGDIQIEGIMINTFSLLDENIEFSNLRSQLYLPYTREISFFIIFILTILPILYLTVFSKIRKKISGRWMKKRYIRPYTIINGLIRELGEMAGVVSPRHFYIKLADALRSYLSEATGSDFISITTGEMNNNLGNFFTDNRVFESTAEIMNFADEIKFSGKRAAKAYQRRDLVKLRRLVSLIEKELTTLRMQEDNSSKNSEKKIIQGGEK